MLLAGSSLDGGYDLAGHAEFGKAAEAGFSLGAVVADGLVESDVAFLNKVIGVAPGDEVGLRLHPDEVVILRQQPLGGLGITGLCKANEGLIVVEITEKRISVGVVRHPYRPSFRPVSYTHLRAHETDSYLVCRL